MLHAQLEPTDLDEPIKTDQLVCIIFLEGDDYMGVLDAANDFGNSIEGVVAHLSQWDYGDENDGAATINGYTDLASITRDRYHQVEHGGIDYWLTEDHDYGYYGLYRRPLQG